MLTNGDFDVAFPATIGILPLQRSDYLAASNAQPLAYAKKRECTILSWA
jgi:hypothetical protein